MSTAIIELNRLQMHAYHGVLEQENKVGNEFEVSVRIEYPCEHAMITDRLDSTVNYADLAAIVRDEMSRTSKLLENVAYRIYTEILRRYPRIIGGEVRIVKLHPPIKGQLESCGFTYRW